MKQLIGYLITISILLSQDMLTTKTGKIYEGELVSYSTERVSIISGGVQYSLPKSTVESLVLEEGTVLIKENKIVLENYRGNILEAYDTSSVKIIKQFNDPIINKDVFSSDSIFHLIVEDNGSVVLENLKLGTKKIISPEIEYGCGSIGCPTPEQRAIFTKDDRYAITTSAFLGGPTIVWDTRNWIDVSEKINFLYGGMDGGYFRVSPNGQYLALMHRSWMHGLSLAIIDLNNYESKMIAGTVWGKEVEGKESEALSGLSFEGNDYWLNDYMETYNYWLNDYVEREDYNFCFTNNSKSLIIKISDDHYIIYDISKHSLSNIKSSRQVDRVRTYYHNWETKQKSREQTYRDGEIISETCWDEGGNEIQCQ